MILLVEDNQDLIDLIKYILDEYNVHSAQSCKEALEKLEQFNYSLVIIDVKLPDFTGTYLGEEISKTYNVPMAFLTNYGTETTKEIAEEIGAKYWYKPDIITNPVKLVKEVKEYLNETRCKETR